MPALEEPDRMQDHEDCSDCEFAVFLSWRIREAQQSGRKMVSLLARPANLTLRKAVFVILIKAVTITS